ncbi:ComF family protein [Imperialibacter roseus]|uniref:ComF family protein n=1 Tax=Imperialibacter roseus TaxID=1324217 RepID=A0ABZ0IPV4_9BACT|nr:ComF family protein [Imperialibacter roseus]WOK06209.1 ComF family protein [Imperialibacter roseus]
MANIANELWNDFVSLIFPENCISCGELLVRGEDHLCTACRYQLPIVDEAIRDSLLTNKFVYEPKISFVDAFLTFKKSGITQKLLHQLKYKGNRELGVMLGAWYGNQLTEKPGFSAFDIIVPVPLHKRKLRIRGYNQSMAIAEGLSVATQKPVDAELLVRSKFTSTQTKKQKVDRWQNVENIFGVTSPESVKGKKVLLVDDVLTTGSTLSSCASALISAGAEGIGICALAVSHK